MKFFFLNPSPFHGTVVGTAQCPRVAFVEDIKPNDGAAAYFVPGSVCRQTDLLARLSLCKQPVFLERGPFLTPSDFEIALQKLAKSDVYPVDAGSTFGISERILDVRALSMLQTHHFGVSLASLMHPQNTPFSRRPNWIDDTRFSDCYFEVSRRLGAKFFVVTEEQFKSLESRSLS